jgi:hypothetical protein
MVDTFAIDWNVSTMIKELTGLLKSRTPVTTSAKDDRFFGDKGQVQVVLLAKTDELINLHLDVIERLEKGGLTLNDPQFSREGFLPHSTVQSHARLNKGDRAVIDALSIIDFFPGNNPYERKVLATVPLNSDRS